MKTSISYLEDALEKMGDETDRKKAEQLKMTPQALWNYRNGVSKMDNFACISIGRYLGIDPMEIIAACEEERAKSEEKQGFWRDFRSSLGTKLAAVLTIGTAMMMAPNPAQAAALSHIANHDIVFIMSNNVRKFDNPTPLSRSTKTVQRHIKAV